jgi:ATP-dependent Clp protease protease subunit
MEELFTPVELELKKELENLQLPSPDLLQYYADTRKRIVWIDYEIDSSLLFVVKQILQWNREDVGIPKEKRKPICLLIFSPGGDLYAAFSCIDTILLSETPVITVNMGEASSAGLYILLSGEKRYCLPSATSVLHSGSAALQGTASQVDSSAQYYKAQLERMKNFVLSKTTIDPKLYKKKYDVDWYFNAEDCIKYGIVDEILTDLNSIIGVDI